MMKRAIRKTLGGLMVISPIIAIFCLEFIEHGKRGALMVLAAVLITIAIAAIIFVGLVLIDS